MNPKTHTAAIDGYVDALPAPGTSRDTARFHLIHSPVDADQLPLDTPDTLYTCTTSDPRIAHALLSEVQPGDLVRVVGTVARPDSPDTPGHITVDTLEVLEAAPVPVLREMVIDRYGDYIVIFDADTDTVPVFTVSGQWVGRAETPDTIATLIDIHERVTGGDA